MGRSKCDPILGMSAGDKVDCDPLGGQGDLQRGQRRTDPFARLRHRFVCQAHDCERGDARAHGALHLDHPRLDPFKGYRICQRSHAAPDCLS